MWSDTVLPAARAGGADASARANAAISPSAAVVAGRIYLLTVLDSCFGGFSPASRCSAEAYSSSARPGASCRPEALWDLPVVSHGPGMLEPGLWLSVYRRMSFCRIPQRQRKTSSSLRPPNRSFQNANARLPGRRGCARREIRGLDVTGPKMGSPGQTANHLRA